MQAKHPYTQNKPKREKMLSPYSGEIITCRVRHLSLVSVTNNILQSQQEARPLLSLLRVCHTLWVKHPLSSPNADPPEPSWESGFYAASVEQRCRCAEGSSGGVRSPCLHKPSQAFQINIHFRKITAMCFGWGQVQGQDGAFGSSSDPTATP